MKLVNIMTKAHKLWNEFVNADSKHRKELLDKVEKKIDEAKQKLASKRISWQRKRDYRDILTVYTDLKERMKYFEKRQAYLYKYLKD